VVCPLYYRNLSSGSPPSGELHGVEFGIVGLWVVELGIGPLG
jgi:hypothetical protein